jgi:hypothetical protein
MRKASTVTALLVATMACASQPAPAATPTASSILTVTGSGPKRTALFVAPAQWHITWSSGVVGISLYDAADQLVQVVEANGTTSTSEHRAGRFYLVVDGVGSWSVEVSAG